MTEPVFRFAPSANGLLHIGHAYSALLNQEIAQSLGGRPLLRIDDIDGERCRPEFAVAIEEDCAWLGFNYERPAAKQSDHLHLYAEALTTLREMGLAYPAFMSRGEVARIVAGHEQHGGIWPRDPDGSPHYPADDRMLDSAEADARMAAGEPFAIRLAMAEATRVAGTLTWQEFDPDDRLDTKEMTADPGAWGDVLLAGRDIPASYHLAVVIDDATQDITHVVRGEDLRSATAVHRLLQNLLGLPEPAYHHHHLIRDDEGRKLSKTDGDTGVAALRSAGVSVAEIREAIGLPA